MGNLYAESELFQSTLPARGATAVDGAVVFVDAISIHAPREGSDAMPAYTSPPPELFQSTLPARGATGGSKPSTKGENISIHAPREGSDALARFPLPVNRDFNPRSPRGERR